MESNTSPDRLLKLPDVMSRVSLSKTTIYQYISEGKFPPAAHLGPHCVRWRESLINQWICSRSTTIQYGSPAYP